jgi:CRP/FNR family cyclic AMP-dependent transcriptional regulator
VDRVARNPAQQTVAGAARGRARVARVLEEDPDLGEGLDPAPLAAAIETARANVLHVARGTWSRDDWPISLRTGFGLLVLDGMLLRRVDLAERFGLELLTSGDLLRPWQREDSVASVPRQHGWQVLEPCRLAILDLEFAHRVSAHPQIGANLVGRALRRSRWFAVNMAIVQQPKVQTRLHMLLWHLADRWGTVTPDGVSMMPVPLTQETLAALVAAKRPTVTSALQALEHDGRLTRDGTTWMLHGSPPGELLPSA